MSTHKNVMPDGYEPFVLRTRNGHALLGLLNRLYTYNGNWDKNFLNFVAEIVNPHHFSMYGVYAGGGRPWHWVFCFGDEYAVAFPQTSARIGDKKSVPDRPIAVLTRGEPNIAEIERTLRSYVNRLGFLLIQEGFIPVKAIHQLVREPRL